MFYESAGYISGDDVIMQVIKRVGKEVVLGGEYLGLYKQRQVQLRQSELLFCILMVYHGYSGQVALLHHQCVHPRG